jgi:hypothetical protein
MTRTLATVVAVLLLTSNLAAGLISTVDVAYDDSVGDLGQVHSLTASAFSGLTGDTTRTTVGLAPPSTTEGTLQLPLGLARLWFTVPVRGGEHLQLGSGLGNWLADGAYACHSDAVCVVDAVVSNPANYTPSHLLISVVDSWYTQRVIVVGGNTTTLEQLHVRFTAELHGVPVPEPNTLQLIVCAVGFIVSVHMVLWAMKNLRWLRFVERNTCRHGILLHHACILCQHDHQLEKEQTDATGQD